MKNFHTINILSFLLFLVLVILDTFFGIALWVYFLLFGLWFFTITLGSFSMGWNLYLNTFTSQKKSTKKRVAITFDDGPHPEFTLKVLAILQQYQAKATFFCIGQNIENHPDIFRQIVENGHAIGNHSFSHDVLIDFNSTENWLNEIKQTDHTMHKIIGSQSKLFRPPFGVTTPKLANALKITEHLTIGWSIRSYDTIIKNPERILKRIITRIRPDAIILLHDKQANVLLVLEHLLQFLQKQDYQTVTINELIDDH